MTGGKVLYRAEGLPVFQNRMFSSRDEAIACQRGDVVLAQSPRTGLISNIAFEPELVQYGADYQNEQAESGVFRDHLRAVERLIGAHFQDHKLMEIGCGKGFFLELLADAGYEIVGVDPAYDGPNPNVLKERYRPGLGLRADGVLLRHVLEHVLDPLGFLESIRVSNGGGGKIFIEVPCLDWICRQRAWFDVFYEHVNYFRLRDFHQVFGKVYDSGHLFAGQYLYVVADLATLREPGSGASDGFRFPPDFLHTVSRCASRVRTQPRCIVWGAASKGVIFTLFLRRADARVSLLVDINPAKQGKHVAATGMRVSSPQELLPRLEPGHDVFVMNHNYLDEVRRLTRGRHNLLTLGPRGISIHHG